jgi:transcription initiation factor IIF auxiliary subunit
MNEVTEMGWGEFEAGVRIFFKDPDEKVTYQINDK